MLLAHWYPEGKWDSNNKNFKCSNIDGIGKTFSMHILRETGQWHDFSDDSSGNLLNIYAHKHGISTAEAHTKIAQENGIHLNGTAGHAYQPTIAFKPPTPPPPTIQDSFIPIKEGDSPPQKFMARYDQAYLYKDTQGRPLFYILKKGEGKSKVFVPLSYSTKLNKIEYKEKPNPLYETFWYMEGWKPKWPLYGVEELAKYPERDVLVVEGEKCVHAGRKLLGDKAVVVANKGGTGSTRYADWSPLYGRKKVILWPDADKTGREARDKIASHLVDKVEILKFIDVTDLEKTHPKWDVHDAVETGMNYDKFVDFCEKRLVHSPNVMAEPKEIEKQNNKQNVKIHAFVPEDYLPSERPPQDILQKWSKWRIKYNKRNHVPDHNQHNVIKVFENDEAFKDSFYLDEFSEDIYTSLKKNKDHSFSKGKERLFNDKDERAIATYFQKFLWFPYLRKDKVLHDSILDFCENNKRNRSKERILKMVEAEKDNIDMDNLGKGVGKFFHELLWRTANTL